MGADRTATAEGDLGRTPLGHLLVYALDHGLSGILFLREASGTEHAVQLVRGAPVKLRSGDSFARLGEMLVEAGAVSQRTVEDAIATMGLLGDVLVLAGRVDRDVLEQTAQLQFVRRMVRLFELPADTRYRYCAGDTELDDYGGEPVNLDPLALLWAGLRAHGGASTMMQGTLGLVGDAALRLHPLATTARFGLNEPEEKVIEELRKGPAPLSRLQAIGALPEEALRRLCYALLITRQIDLGTGTVPVGAMEPARTPPAGVAVVAKMQLRPTMHRVGAAAPDPPGGGERTSSPGLRANEARAVPDAEGSSPRSAPSARRSSLEPAGDADPRATLKSASTPPPPPPESEEETASPSGDPTYSAVVRGKASAGAAAAAQVTVLSAPVLYQLAVARFAERNFEGALEACAMARKAAPGEHDYMALAIWIRAHMPGADLKAIAVELDELLAAHEAQAQAHYYRAMLRRRLGDDAGALRDLRRVKELAPAHADAARELGLLEARRPKFRGGLFGRLFRR